MKRFWDASYALKILDGLEYVNVYRFSKKGVTGVVTGTSRAGRLISGMEELDHIHKRDRQA